MDAVAVFLHKPRGLPKRERIAAYARFLRREAPTGCRWLGTGECEEIAAICEAYLKRTRS